MNLHFIKNELVLWCFLGSMKSLKSILPNNVCVRVANKRKTVPHMKFSMRSVLHPSCHSYQHWSRRWEIRLLWRHIVTVSRCTNTATNLPTWSIVSVNDQPLQQSHAIDKRKNFLNYFHNTILEFKYKLSVLFYWWHFLNLNINYYFSFRMNGMQYTVSWPLEFFWKITDSKHFYIFTDGHNIPNLGMVKNSYFLCFIAHSQCTGHGYTA